MRIHSFNVVPSLPEPLVHLRDLASNLRWSWDPDTYGLFMRLDRDLWNKTYHNPVKMLGWVKQKNFEDAARDDGFRAHLETVWEDFQSYITGKTWFSQNYGKADVGLIAYFSAEFGICEALPIYSGGLGVLAADHMKASSDMGLPIVGVSLLYRRGYFRQYLNADGWQQEFYPENDFYNLAVTLVRDEAKQPVHIEVEFPGRTVYAQIWKMALGRVELVMLDTNLPENQPEDREITANLYGGDHEMRMRQEIMLGIGGVRALAKLGIEPSVYHMNEGHSAFLALERIRRIMEENKTSFDVAREAVTASTVFTTHTPVAAGNDIFPPGMMDRYFGHFAEPLGLSLDDLLALGRQNPRDRNEGFCMTILALNLASFANGVSQLHGEVSRHMWRNVWPEVIQDEVPIQSVTNGIHTRSWISHEMATLLDRYLGPRWAEDPADQSVWARVEEIPDAELWRTHERRRERLVAFARRRLREQLARRGAPESEMAQADEILDPEALTIGFARRFAMYKRGTLILREPERLLQIINQSKRPVQILFAGKAHPADNGGKELIRQLIHFMRGADVRRHIMFIEDYDVNVARYLVQGVDVWLNTPRRPLEACGTSGMKAAVNGALNLSTLDGWWVEGYDPSYGWSIGLGEEYDDFALQDDIEAAALYDILEKEVVPEFYNRGADGLPRAWIARMKGSMHHIAAQFNANRMVREYFERAYLPAARMGKELGADKLQAAVRLAEWKRRVGEHWGQIELTELHAAKDTEIKVGEEMPVEATIRLGEIRPEDVSVEIYQGQLNSKGEITEGSHSELRYVGSENGVHYFRGAVSCSNSGRFGFALRVLPRNDSLPSPFEPKLIYWA